MKVLIRQPDKPLNGQDIFRYEMTAEEKLRNDIAAIHSSLYCDRQCPSGATGMATWHDVGGACWDCKNNPYNMDVTEADYQKRYLAEIYTRREKGRL